MLARKVKTDKMLKLLILMSAIAAVKCDTTLVEETPKTTSWLWVLTPKSSVSIIDSSLCSGWLNMTRKENQICTCGTSKAPLLEVSFPDGVQGEYPFIAVDSEEEIRAAINVTCVCPEGAADRRLMGKLLEPGYAFFASCEPNPKKKESVGCWPEIFAKSPPTPSKLREIMRSIKFINEEWKITCSKDVD